MAAPTTRTHIHRFRNGLTGYIQVREQRIVRCDVFDGAGASTRSPIEDLDYRWEFVRWLASIEADVEAALKAHGAHGAHGGPAPSAADSAPVVGGEN